MPQTHLHGFEFARTPGLACILVAIFLAACQTPAPQVPIQAPPKPQLSTLNVPVRMSLELAAAEVDQAMPREAGVTPFALAIQGGSESPACGVDAGYSIVRGPVAMAGGENAIRTTFDLSYWVQGRKQVPCPGNPVVASCGIEGEAPRTARVSIDTTLAVLPDLATRVQSSLVSVVPGERCILNPVGIDATEPLIAAFQNALAPMLVKLDQRMAAGLQLRQRVEAAWARMAEPVQLRPGIWLVLHPEGLGVVPVSITQGELVTGVQVRLRPVVSAGNQPQTAATALPQADVAAASDAFELHIPVEVEHSFVQSRLDDALDIPQGGTTVSLGKFRIRITSADAYGEGSKVVVKLAFQGDVNGTAYLNGTPYYDAATRTLSFPDLDYTLETDRTLLNSANWLAQGEIRERLRTRFTIDLTRPVDEMKQGLEQALNRRRGNLQLHGEVQEFRLLGIYRTQNGSVFTAHLSTRGKLAAEIDPE